MNIDVLTGKRVMICEDELLVSMLIEQVLEDHGCTVVGPYSTVDGALNAAREAELDIAILDVNLRGRMIYPVAEALEARGIPFFLLSGYGSDAVPSERSHWAACCKPFDTAELVGILSRLLRPAAAGDPRTALPTI